MLISPFIIKNFSITAQAIDINARGSSPSSAGRAGARNKFVHQDDQHGEHFCSLLQMNYALLQCKRFHKFHVWDIILLVNKNNTLLHLRAQGKTGNFAEDLCIPENGLSLGKTTSAKRYPDFLMERIFY